MTEASTPTQSPSSPDEITLASAPGDDRDPHFEDLKTGTVVGRYIMVDKIGAGAMGMVFAAYDPELNRKIALKFLHMRGSATLDARARLLREAKSLARLSHPNVVAVHDVGTYGDHVFLAMEFVAGRTLTAWLKEQPRRWPEIVDILGHAGEGLAAAHDAGLVHRDFKPDNVLIGDDGRVRVLDFGLARAADAAEPSGAVSDARAALVSASVSASRSRESEHEEVLVTRTGALVGTPAYMSPEQHLGQAADALSDQFSFCVTLYQALYGVRPFSGTRLSALAYQIIQGKVEAPPAGAKVPAWLRRVIVRGLSIAPEQRHPSMHALLAALRRDRNVVRRHAWAAVGLGGVGVGLGLWLASAPAGEPPCQGAAQRLVGVWDDARIAAIEQAFHASSAPYAVDTWQSTRAALSDYAERWKQAHHDACAATHIRREQSEQTLDLRMRCLDRRLGRLAALSESLLHPTTDAIRTAPEAISTLGDIAACADADHLSIVVPPPDDPARVAAIEAHIAEASARELAADLEGAFQLSFLAAEDAAKLGYPPLEAEALLVHARVQDRLGNHEPAALSYTAAIAAAAKGHDDRLVATAWVDFAFHVGAYQPDATRLDDLRLAAEAAIARAGDDLWLRARLGQAAATMLQRLGRPDQALLALLPALDVLDRDPEREPARRQQALNTAGLAYINQGNFSAAHDALQRALAAARRLYGPSHPAVAAILNNLATLALDMKDIDGADKHAREAAEIIDNTLPERHPARASSARIRAQIAEQRDDLPRAQALYEEALAFYREQPDVDRMYLGSFYNDLAILADRQGDLERARAHFRDALKLFRARFGADNVYARMVERNLAEISLWLDDPKAALDIADRLLATAPEEPPIVPPRPYILCLRAQAQLALGNLPAAFESADEAVRLLDAREGGITDAEEGALVQVTLARVLAARGTDTERRLTLVYLAEPVLKASKSTAARRALAALDALSRPPARRGQSRAP